MNRQMRRASQSHHKREIKKAMISNEWTPFEDRTQEVAPKFTANTFRGFFANNLYSVQVFDVEGKIVAGIRRHDQSTNISWATKQRIKNEIFGTESGFVEVFPPESLLVDDANMYWLWMTDTLSFDLNKLRVK